MLSFLFYSVAATLLNNLQKLNQFDMYSWRASALVQVSVLESYAKLACVSGPNGARVGKFVR